MVSPRPIAAAAGCIGLSFVLFALTIVAGPHLHLPWAVTSGEPRLGIAFETGLNLALLGVGIGALAVGSWWRGCAKHTAQVAASCGGLVAALCGLRVIEAASGRTVAPNASYAHGWVDHAWLSGWIGATHPSQMLAFGMIGGALALVPGLDRRRWAMVFCGLLAMSLLISGADLLGKTMSLEYLYPAWLEWRAPDASAVCGILAALAVGCAARARHPRLWRPRISPEDIIVWISGGCVVLAGLGATMTAFIIQIDSAGKTFGSARAHALASYAEEFNQALLARMESPRLITTSARVQEALRHPTDNAARLRGAAALQVYQAQGYSYLALRTLTGDAVLGLGTEALRPDLAIRLRTEQRQVPEHVTLQWVHGFAMRAQTPVMANGVQIGWLVTERPLTHMTARYTATSGTGITETLALSGLDVRGRLMSFPQRFDAHVFELPALTPERKPLPSRLAVQGETGYGQWHDIHGTPTAVGYTPVGHTGLALISKIATVELYAPMRLQFERLGGVMLCLMIGSVLAIRLTVRPFANRLAASERALRTANQNLERRRDALRASREQLRLVADNVPAQLSYVDADNVLRFASRTLLEAFGCTQAQMLDRHVREIYTPDDYRTLLPYMAEVLAGYPVQFEFTSLRTGTPRYFSGHYYPDYDDRGILRGYFSVLQNLTQRKITELALTRSERALKLVLDNAPLLVSHIDGNEVFTFCNITHARWLQRTPEDVCGRHAREVFTPGTYALLAPYVQRALAGESVVFEINAPWYERAVGVGPRSRTRYFRGHFVVDATDSGEHDGFYAFVQDVTEAKRSEIALSRMAHFDALTGLPNRYELYDRLRTALERRQRQPSPMGVLYLDVDHFKHINDTYGHAAGDAVLVEVAQRLQRAVRRTDTVARLAGDEFIILLDPIDAPDDALHTAQKVVTAIRPPIHLRNDVTLNVTASIGVACPGAETTDADTVLREADRALYWAKSRGRDTAA